MSLPSAATLSRSFLRPLGLLLDSAWPHRVVGVSYALNGGVCRYSSAVTGRPATRWIEITETSVYILNGYNEVERYHAAKSGRR